MAFTSFRNKIQSKKQISNGDEYFTGLITYKSDEYNLREFLRVTLILTSQGYGSIRIDDGDKINIEKVHMDFNLNHQRYKLTGNGSLIINGNSDKIGNYEVTILDE